MGRYSRLAIFFRKMQNSGLRPLLSIPVLLIILLCSAVNAAPAPEGARISNIAFADYKDEQGSQRSVESNRVEARVQGLSAFTLQSSQSKPGQAGSAVAFSHLLTNTGNITDRYDIAVTRGVGDTPFNQVQLYADADCNGLPDNPALPLQTTSSASVSWEYTTPALVPGQSLCIISSGTLSHDVQPGKSAGLAVMVKGNAQAAGNRYTPAGISSNADQALVQDGAQLDVHKSLSLISGESPSQDILVTLSYFNHGNAAATNITLMDILGHSAVTQPFPLVLGGGSSLPYDTTGFIYVAGSARWSQGGTQILTEANDTGVDPAGISYSYDTGLDQGTQRVRAVIATIAAGQSGNLTFKIKARANLPGGSSTQTTNRAGISYSSNGTTRYDATNAVIYQVTQGLAPAAIDLTVTQGSDTAFTAGYPGFYTFTVQNNGLLATTGVLELTILLAKGLRFISNADNNHWRCSGDGQWAEAGEKVRCVSNEPLLGSTNGAPTAARPAVLQIIPETSVFPDLAPSGKEITTSACVSGGEEQAAYSHNNCSTGVATLYPSSTLSGRVWLDGNHDSQYDTQNDLSLSGWKVVICPYDPAEDAGTTSGQYAAINDCLIDPLHPELGNGGTVSTQYPGYATGANGQPVAAVQTDSQGNFTLTGLKPGKYKLQFRNANNTLIEGPAKNQSATAGGRSTLHWSRRFLIIDLSAGLNLADQNLPLDPAGVIYDTLTRKPLAGAIVKLNGPAGFDPALHLLGGAAAAQQTTIVNGSPIDGGYQFILTGNYPAGQYTLDITAPAGYQAGVSKAYPAQSGSIQAPDKGCKIIGGICSVDATGSSQAPPVSRKPYYYTSYLIDPATRIDVMNNHIPIDPLGYYPDKGQPLLVSKTADRSIVELGDFISYTVTVRSTVPETQPGVKVEDQLPIGFRYVEGSTRFNGSALEPVIAKNGKLTWDIGALKGASSVNLLYRVAVGTGAMLGDGVNRAAAYTTTNRSAEARLKVKVLGGVFSDKGFILGKVYADCNQNRLQDKDEPGIGGVRLLLDDGSFVITDLDGKYSLYGIDPRAHTLKLDQTTLPLGSQLEALDNRNAGKPDNRFIDLKKGEMYRADYALNHCTSDLLKALDQRKDTLQKQGLKETETERVGGTILEARPGISQGVIDPRTQPASGYISQNGSIVSSAQNQSNPNNNGVGLFAAIAAADGVDAQKQAPDASSLSGNSASQKNPLAPPGGTLNDANSSLPIPSILTTPLKTGSQLIPLEEDLKRHQDNHLAILYPQDGDTLPIAQTWVRVKGPMGGDFTLIVNGTVIDSKLSVGKRVTQQDKNLQAWEYIGINLHPGKNSIQVKTIDSFGVERGQQTIHIIAPDGIGKIDLQPISKPVADGRTPVRVRLRLTDNQGIPVTTRTPVTLESTRGKWSIKDINPTEPGVQVFIEGGEADYELLPPLTPEAETLTASSGLLKVQKEFKYQPDLRPLIGTGLIEGALNLRRLTPSSLAPASHRDSFDREIQTLQCTDNQNTCAGVRSSLYLKGKVKGDLLLTLAYDTDKDETQRLFRDIRPDEFYPIYGDSSVKGFDAQSSQRLYVRVDKGNSSLMYGDYTTASTHPARKLTQYSRSLTGIWGHHETASMQFTLYGSRDTLTQVIDEIAANGTSGPYLLSNTQGIVNSEKIELIVRDRNQPSLILQQIILTRLVDYQIEMDTGRLLFKAPVSTYDLGGNPQTLRITYEVDQGGEKFTIAGAEGQIKLTNNLEIGGMGVTDHNPSGPYRLGGLNSTLKLGKNTYLIAEGAYSQASGTALTDSNSSALISDTQKGHAARAEFTSRGDNWDIRAYASNTSTNFINPSSSLDKGRTEAGIKGSLKPEVRTTIQIEGTRTQDNANAATRAGILLNAVHDFNQGIRGEIGVRRSTDQLTTATTTGGLPGGILGPTIGANIGKVGDTTTTTSIRGRLTAQVPYTPSASVFAEYEQQLNGSGHNAGIGGDWLLGSKTKLYGRHNFVSQIDSPFAVTQTTANQTTLFGLQTDYAKDAQAYSEYRIQSALDAQSAEAAIGLKNQFQISEGLRVSTTAEKVKTLDGLDNAATAGTVGAEYTINPNTKLSGRIEARSSVSQESRLLQANLANRLTDDFSLLARLVWDKTRNKNNDTNNDTDNDNTSGSSLLQPNSRLEHLRIQTGVAWRDLDTNRLSALGKIEYRTEQDTSLALPIDTHTWILSAHANYQADPGTVYSGRIASKWNQDRADTVSSTNQATLLFARITHDLDRHWDIGATSSLLFGSGAQQYGLGLEAGYLVGNSLRLGVGYNFFGFRDRDLTDFDRTDRGIYLTLRYKFDEGLFGWLDGNLSSAAGSNASPDTAASNTSDKNNSTNKNNTNNINTTTAHNSAPTAAPLHPEPPLEARLPLKTRTLYQGQTAQLQADAQPMLNALAKRLIASKRPLAIAAADVTPNRCTVQSLLEHDRATTLAAYLTRQGTLAPTIIAAGSGQNPIPPNSDAHNADNPQSDQNQPVLITLENSGQNEKKPQSASPFYPLAAN